MFEQIVLRKSSSGPALTLGEVAEALLFYRKVHLVLDYGGINSLIDSLGMPGLLALLKRGNVTATYTEEMLGVNTQTINGMPIHRFAIFKISGDQTVGALKSRKDRLIYLLNRKGHDKREARRLAETFLERVPVRPFSGKYFSTEGLDKLALSDVLDRSYLLDAIQRIARRTPGFETLPTSVEFDAMAVGEGGFHVYTNIDFDAANARRKLLGNGLEPATPALWLANILDARVDTALASHYGGEFYTSDQTSELVRLRYSELLRKSAIASEERRSFIEVVLNNYPSIRDVINARERSFDEFLSILDRSDRFRQWAQSIHPDAKLVQEYFQEVTAESWLTSFPARVVRYVLASATGLASVPAGLGLAAADSLLLDKIVKGWRPSHFVDGKLKPFLNEDGGA